MTALDLRQRHLADQLDAAGEDTRAQLVTLAADLNGSTPTRRVSRGIRNVLREFAARISDGLALCQHLTDTSAAPWWLPGSPDRLRCADCAEAALLDAQPHICAACGCDVEAPIVEVAATPALLLRRAEETVTVPAALVLAALCKRCTR